MATIPESFIAITLGTRGFYAVMYTWTANIRHSYGGYYEPWIDDSLSFAEPDAAIEVAEEWAVAEGIKYIRSSFDPRPKRDEDENISRMAQGPEGTGITNLVRGDNVS
jgi:hypothetical protein